MGLNDLNALFKKRLMDYICNFFCTITSLEYSILWIKVRRYNPAISYNLHRVNHTNIVFDYSKSQFYQGDYGTQKYPTPQNLWLCMTRNGKVKGQKLSCG